MNPPVKALMPVPLSVALLLGSAFFVVFALDPGQGEWWALASWLIAAAASGYAISGSV